MSVYHMLALGFVIVTVGCVFSGNAGLGIACGLMAFVCLWVDAI